MFDCENFDTPRRNIHPPTPTSASQGFPAGLLLLMMMLPMTATTMMKMMMMTVLLVIRMVGLGVLVLWAFHLPQSGINLMKNGHASVKMLPYFAFLVASRAGDVACDANFSLREHPHG